ncbi:MAG: serine/threonine protein kinase [Deltaproteobacteria bacterium]|nr:serine/threonine protein kinase [Deltaproteobacteria bacterium]
MDLPYRFGRYVLLKKIAQGGMAEIFSAKYLGESGFSKDVCIKRLLPVWSDNPSFVKMLIDEAKALVHLTHPNIVQVYELGRDGKTFYISMELVAGIDLRRLFQKTAEEGHPLPLKFVFYIVSEILKALKFAHQRKNEEGRDLKIVHRDISPQNILLSFDGQVKVTDFGIAKGIHRSLETTQHQIKGKYAYMSPEQARGETVDERTDLYAAGILLFELLERKRLFDSANDLATLEKVRKAALPDEALQNYPARLRAVVLKALQREKKYRHPDAADFLKDLQQVIAGERLETQAEEFSEYLRTLFPPAAFQNTRAENAFPAATGKLRRNFSKAGRPAGMFLFLAVLSFWLWKGVFQTGRQVIDTPPVALASPPSASEKPLTGSVTIDAQPKPARGVLKLGEIKKEFVTPFQLAALDLSRAQEGTVVLKSEWGQEKSEILQLSAEQPHWVRTFQFEEPRPAFLKVSARPWGEVTIPGVVSRRETPLAGVKLQSGKYLVQVFYPPQNQKLEQEIQLAAGAQLLCQAEFGESPRFLCR